MQGKNISHQGEDKRKKKLRRGRRGGGERTKWRHRTKKNKKRN
jgi:hypothetical protein